MSTELEITIDLGMPEAYDGELDDIVEELRKTLDDQDFVRGPVREVAAPANKKLAAEWLPVLEVALSAPAILLAIKAARDVVIEKIKKNKKLKITFKTKNGSVTLDALNIEEGKIEKVANALTTGRDK